MPTRELRGAAAWSGDQSAERALEQNAEVSFPTSSPTCIREGQDACGEHSVRALLCVCFLTVGVRRLLRLLRLLKLLRLMRINRILSAPWSLI